MTWSPRTRFQSHPRHSVGLVGPNGWREGPWMGPWRHGVSVRCSRMASSLFSSLLWVDINKFHPLGLFSGTSPNVNQYGFDGTGV